MTTAELVVEVLYTEGCPHHDALLPRLRRLIQEAGHVSDLQLVRVDDPHQAARLRFLGSPTVRINGHDIDPEANRRTDSDSVAGSTPARTGSAAPPPTPSCAPRCRRAARTDPSSAAR